MCVCVCACVCVCVRVPDALTSATGEDVAELHIHGSRAVVSATLEALLCLPVSGVLASAARPRACGVVVQRRAAFSLTLPCLPLCPCCAGGGWVGLGLGAGSQMVRLAEAGEFTRRAVQNEKLDLAEVGDRAGHVQDTAGLGWTVGWCCCATRTAVC